MNDLLALFPGVTQAERLAKPTKFISEFIDASLDRPFRQTTGRALIQIHCHHHAVLSTTAEQRVLDRTGLDYSIMRSGRSTRLATVIGTSYSFRSKPN